MMANIKETFNTKKNVGKTLVENSNDIGLNKHVTKLINLDKNKRISVSNFYNNISGEKPINQANNNKKNYYMYNMYDMFEIDGFSEQNFVRSKLIQLFLACDIKINIPIENIFLTFKLLYKLQRTDEATYITNAIILFSLTTKLVSPVEILLIDTVHLINYMTKIDMSIDNLTNIMINLLEKLNWNTDVESLISYVPCIAKNVKMDYLIISLALLCDRKYDIFTTDYLHKMILLLLDCGKNTQIIYVENIYMVSHLLNNMLESINKMDDSASMQGKLIKEYLNSIDCDYLLEKLKNIDISNLC